MRVVVGRVGGWVGWGGARAVRREENLGEKKGLTCKKCDLGGQNAKTQHGLKMAFSSRRSFCTGWGHKRSTGRGRAPRVKIGSQLTPRMVPNRALSAPPVVEPLRSERQQADGGVACV